MISALIQTNTSCEPEGHGEDTARSNKPRQLKLNNAFRTNPRQRKSTKPIKSPSATLIVAPTSLLNQWSEEIQRSSQPNVIKVFIWHGQGRLDLEAMVDDEDDDKQIRVVITSYGVLASEHAKSEKLTTTKSSIFESQSRFSVLRH